MAGLLFLQDIQDELTTFKPPLIHILRRVAGEDAIRKFIFVTTRWDLIEANYGRAKEREICRRCLGPLLRSGARMDRFDKKTETAWGILHPLLRQNGTTNAIESDSFYDGSSLVSNEYEQDEIM